MTRLKTHTTMPLAAVVLLLALSACASTGRIAPPDPAVTDITDSMPAETTAEEDRHNMTLISMGPSSMLDLCRMLLPPGEEDDSGARFALSSLSRYVGRPDAETERLMFVRALTNALEERSEPEVRAFLISLFANRQQER